MDHFGEHITIDGYGGNKDLLDNQEFIVSCLNELPTVLGMLKLVKPEVYHAPGNTLKDPGGWSGFVVIAESHISIHTFPERRFLSADVYTCRNGMDKDSVVGYFQEKFQLQDVEMNFIKRGIKYPSHNID